ncbi:BON domain-containing protein [Basilea psittacipulmonis]|uniref:BON domain-containing protein n=1 Tax=Basilea psittacipulmonis TaxID=1472345 RepID=UPI000689CF8F|nr:BON domain-containing protein [Basilea psittacipulmonis]
MKTTFLKPIMLSTLIALSAPTILSGCVPLLVGGAFATGTSIVTDRRTSSAQLADKEIYLRANNRLSSEEIGDLAYVAKISYNQSLYLVGQVPSQAIHDRVIEIAKEIPNVRQVVDRLTIEPSISFSTKTSDKWLSSKVQSALLTASGVPYRTINILTVDGVVYLFGIVTQEEGNLAAQTAARVSGVKQVVQAFEYITNNELESGVYPNAITPHVNKTSK